MSRPPPKPNRTNTLFPYPTLFRSTGHAGLADRRRAGTQAPGFALGGRRASRNAGANVLGGEIKGEASAAGRRRRTFAPKGIRTRRPAVLRTKRFPLSREKNQKKPPAPHCPVRPGWQTSL